MAPSDRSHHLSAPAMAPTGGESPPLQRMLNQLAVAAARLPDAPALLTTSNRQVTEVLRAPNGDLRVLAATAGTA